MNGFNEALKLYLRFPSEMEYWSAYSEDEEPPLYAATVLAQIAGDGDAQDTFLDSCDEVYQSALDDFNEKIIGPLTNRMRKLSSPLPKNCKVSFPRKITEISYYSETCFTPIGGGRASAIARIGCAFRIEQGSPSGDPQLVAYPYVCFRSQAPVSPFIEKMKDIEFCNSNNSSEGWDRNIAFVRKGIPVKVDAQPEDIVDEIVSVYTPAYRVLEREPEFWIGR